MIHIIVGDEAAKNLEAAFELDENLRGEIVVLKDTLGVGPIAFVEEVSQDKMRSEFWQTISGQADVKVTDTETIQALVTKAIEEEEPVCFWLSPCVTDVCAYYWLLPYFKPYADVLHTINVIGLPFLNEKGQMFYPNNFSQVPPKEFVKTKRLLKNVTIAEYEVEGDEWAKLQAEDNWVRVYEGGKKIQSKALTHFDALLKSSLTAEFQKGSKVVNEAQKKCTETLSHLFLEWRLRELIKNESVVFQGDLNKTTRDFEVKKIGEPVVSVEEELNG